MEYTVGMKIQIIEMDKEPNYKNKIGIIEHIDDLGQLHGSWGSLAIIPEIDIIKILEVTNENKTQ